MKEIKFSRRKLDGLNIYPARNTNLFRIAQDRGAYCLQFLTDRGYRYTKYRVEGFKSMQEAESWLNRMDWEHATLDEINPAEESQADAYLDVAFEVLGLYKEGEDKDIWSNIFRNEQGAEYTVRVSRSPDGELYPSAYKDGKKLADASVGGSTYDVDRMFRIVDSFMRKHRLKAIEACMLMQSEHREAVMAAINTRDLTKGMVRCKSSNVWGYNINIRDNKSKTGDMVMQFKGKNGGPGDIYIYYDVPVRTYRRMHSVSSVGHYFWQYIRNVFKYSKLTSNRKGVLPNAIN